MSFIIRIIRKSIIQKDGNQKVSKMKTKDKKDLEKNCRRFHQNYFDLFLHLFWKGKLTFERYQKRESIINTMIIQKKRLLFI